MGMKTAGGALLGVNQLKAEPRAPGENSDNEEAEELLPDRPSRPAIALEVKSEPEDPSMEVQFEEHQQTGLYEILELENDTLASGDDTRMSDCRDDPLDESMESSYEEMDFQVKNEPLDEAEEEDGSYESDCDSPGSNDEAVEEFVITIKEEAPDAAVQEVQENEPADTVRDPRNHANKKTRVKCLHPLCPQTFSSIGFLKRHMRSHASLCLPKPCESSPSSPKIKASAPSDKKLYHCPHCPKMYPTKQVLNAHIVPSNCTLCPETFPCYGALSLHNTIHEDPESFPGFANDTEPVPASTQSMERVSNLKETVANAGEQEVGSPGLLEPLRAPKKPKVKRQFPCPHCPKVYTTNQVIKAHIVPSQCSFCPEIFPCFGSLKEHARIHVGEKTYTCTQCPKAFSTPYIRAEHMRTHTGEKPFRCPLCPKAYTQSHGLRKHIHTHTGERPFQCSICPKSFTNGASLKSHIRTHTGEKPYTCSECQRPFAERKYLQVHMRIHTGERPFKCPQCPMAYKTRTYLAQHIRNHTGERMHQCPECPKSFAIKSVLEGHLRTHTGERPYVCAKCSKTFKFNSNYLIHIRKHTDSPANSTPI